MKKKSKKVKNILHKHANYFSSIKLLKKIKILIFFLVLVKTGKERKRNIKVKLFDCEDVRKMNDGMYNEGDVQKSANGYCCCEDKRHNLLFRSIK